MTGVTRLFILLAVATITAGAQPSDIPDLLFLNRPALERFRQALRENPRSVEPAVRALLESAEKAMTAELVSVTQKEELPPSGDKHDYMSLGPYWWPDSTKPDGLPYVRRDGEVNPEYRRTGDNERLGAMVDNVQGLALAYAITQDDRFAEKAVNQLTYWFLAPETRMNPHLEFAQAIKGVNQGRGIGIIETYAFRHLIDAVLLLRPCRHWTHEVNVGLNGWLASYLNWLLESQNGKDEAGSKNNHGSTYDVQVSSIAFYLGKTDIATRILKDVAARRIAVQIEPDGSQPLEIERTKSWGYANMNLDALIELAHLGERVGVDLWHFETSKGSGIRKALEFLLPYALGEKKWTWTQIVPREPGRLYYALRMAAEAYDDPSLASAAASILSDAVISSRTMFLLAPTQ